MKCHGCDTELPPKTWKGRDRKWCSDRCRKQTMYARFCVDCGKQLNGSDGNGPKAAIRCVKCAATHSGELRRIWTRDEILDAIRRWERINGEPPRITNWNPTRARDIGRPENSVVYLRGRKGVTPQKAGEWPNVNTVIREFGTWNAGIEAAGFTGRAANHAANRLDRRAA